MATKAEQSAQYQRLIFHVVDIENRLIRIEEEAVILKSLVGLAGLVGMLIGFRTRRLA